MTSREEILNKIKLYEAKWGKLGTGRIMDGNDNLIHSAERSTDMSKSYDNSYYEYRRKVLEGKERNKLAHMKTFSPREMNQQFYDDMISSGRLVHAATMHDGIKPVEIPTEYLEHIAQPVRRDNSKYYQVIHSAFSHEDDDILEHAMYGPSGGTNQYVAKIDDFYGKGKPRYFYSREEWDAYQKNRKAAQQSGADRAEKERVNADKRTSLEKAQGGKYKAESKARTDEQARRIAEEEKKNKADAYNKIKDDLIRKNEGYAKNAGADRGSKESSALQKAQSGREAAMKNSGSLTREKWRDDWDEFEKSMNEIRGEYIDKFNKLSKAQQKRFDNELEKEMSDAKTPEDLKKKFKNPEDYLKAWNKIYDKVVNEYKQNEEAAKNAGADKANKQEWNEASKKTGLEYKKGENIEYDNEKKKYEERFEKNFYSKDPEKVDKAIEEMEKYESQMESNHGFVDPQEMPEKYKGINGGKPWISKQNYSVRYPKGDLSKKENQEKFVKDNQGIVDHCVEFFEKYCLENSRLTPTQAMNEIETYLDETVGHLSKVDLNLKGYDYGDIFTLLYQDINDRTQSEKKAWDRTHKNSNSAKHSSIHEDELMDEYKAFMARAKAGKEKNTLAHSKFISPAELNKRYREDYEKECVLIHAQQYGPSSATNQYVAKLDDYYGKGKPRYFYSRDEYNAYLKNQKSSNFKGSDYQQYLDKKKADDKKAVVKKVKNAINTYHQKKSTVNQAGSASKAKSEGESYQKYLDEQAAKKKSFDETWRKNSLYDEYREKEKADTLNEKRVETNRGNQTSLKTAQSGREAAIASSSKGVEKSQEYVDNAIDIAKNLLNVVSNSDEDSIKSSIKKSGLVSTLQNLVKNDKDTAEEINEDVKTNKSLVEEVTNMFKNDVDSLDDVLSSKREPDAIVQAVSDIFDSDYETVKKIASSAKGEPSELFQTVVDIIEKDKKEILKVLNSGKGDRSEIIDAIGDIVERNRKSIDNVMGVIDDSINYSKAVANNIISQMNDSKYIMNMLNGWLGGYDDHEPDDIMEILADVMDLS